MVTGHNQITGLKYEACNKSMLTAKYSCQLQIKSYI